MIHWQVRLCSDIDKESWHVILMLDFNLKWVFQTVKTNEQNDFEKQDKFFEKLLNVELS